VPEVLADVRSTAVNYALLFHVLGASILVGSLVTAVGMQALGWTREASSSGLMFARLSFRTLLIVSVPAWVVMRMGAAWVASKSGWDKVDPAPKWLDIGFIVAEPGGLLLLISVGLAGIGARRLAQGRGADWLTRSATVLTVIVLAAYLVALWAMTAKPT
jgi:hypothetical protein